MNTEEINLISTKKKTIWRGLKWTLLSVGLFLSFLSVEFISAQVVDSPWPMIHGDSRLTGQSAYDTSKIGGAIKWRFKTAGQVETSPVIASDGTIYIADHTCTLYAINPDSSVKWKFKSGDPVHSVEWGGESCFQASPSIAPDGTIYIAPMSGFVHAITPDGKEKWRYPVFNFKNNWSSPTVDPDHGTIYVGSEAYPPGESGKPEEKTAHVYALNADGTLKWSYDTKGNWSTSTGSIAADGTVYMSGNECNFNKKCENVLYAFDGQTGDVKWRFYHGGVMESSASLATDGTIYFGVKGAYNPREGAKFYAVNPDGKERWSLDIPCGNSIIPGIATDGSIYFGDWDGAFYKINPDGEIIWKVETPKTFETLSSSPAIGAEGTVYFGSLANHFYAYTENGKEKWNYYFKDGGINSSPAIGSDGTIYVGFVPGELIAFGEGNPKSIESGQTNDSPKSDNTPFTMIILLSVAVLLGILTAFLIITFKKRQTSGRLWLVIILPIVVITVILLVALKPVKQEIVDNPTKKGKDITTMEEMFKTGEDFDKTCPEKIVVEGSTYTAHLKERKWEVKNMRQIDWISEQCPDTVWPNNTNSD